MKLVNAVFERKPDCLGTTPCQIEKVVEVPAEEYKAFSEHLYRDQTFIEENIDLMYYDGEGIRHCLLVLGEGAGDGILVESEGAEYARYAAHFSGARRFVEMEQYPMLEHFQKKLMKTVENCVQQLLETQREGRSKLCFDEILSQAELPEFPGRLFLSMLSAKPEIESIELNDGQIEAEIQADYVGEIQEQTIRM